MFYFFSFLIRQKLLRKILTELTPHGFTHTTRQIAWLDPSYIKADWLENVTSKWLHGLRAEFVAEILFSKFKISCLN